MKYILILLFLSLSFSQKPDPDGYPPYIDFNILPGNWLGLDYSSGIMLTFQGKLGVDSLGHFTLPLTALITNDNGDIEYFTLNYTGCDLCPNTNPAFLGYFPHEYIDNEFAIPYDSILTTMVNPLLTIKIIQDDFVIFDTSFFYTDGLPVLPKLKTSIPESRNPYNIQGQSFIGIQPKRYMKVYR